MEMAVQFPLRELVFDSKEQYPVRVFFFYSKVIEFAS